MTEDLRLSGQATRDWHGSSVCLCLQPLIFSSSAGESLVTRLMFQNKKNGAKIQEFCTKLIFRGELA